MDADIKNEFDNLKNFLREHMATKEDLVNLKDELRSELASQVGLNQLTTAVDNLAKLTKDYYDEMAVLRHKVERMEKWILQVSASTGVKYEV
jgi:predicted nuclease with TOPRIM domain